MDPPPPTWGEQPPYHRSPRPLAALSAVATVAAIGVALFRWRPSRIEVQGASMVPTLMPGDWALAVARRRFRRGDIVVVEHPGRPGYEMVKRITGLPKEASVIGRWPTTSSGWRVIARTPPPIAAISDRSGGSR